MKQHYLHLATTIELPATVTEDMRGQLRLAPSSGPGDPDQLVAVLHRSDGSLAYVGLVGIAVQIGDVTQVVGVNTIDLDGEFFTASESPTTEANVSLKWPYTVAIGPFYINDVPASATTQMQMGYFNTASAVSLAATDAFIPVDGVVVGAVLQSDAARSAGTATLRLRLSGTGTAFGGGAIVLDASHTFTHSAFLAPSNGVPVSAGTRLGIEIQTSGWAPITANLAAWVYVLVKP